MTTKLKGALDSILHETKQRDEYLSGGSHTAPELRLLLYCLASSIQAKDILELGYDTGVTIEVLACVKGANVIGVDNASDYAGIEGVAEKALKAYKNCRLVVSEAIQYLRATKDNSFDFIFVDDDHEIVHVRDETYEIMRVLRPGGLAVFHDVYFIPGLLDSIVNAIREVDASWQRIDLQSPSALDGRELGLLIVKKPNL